MRRFFIDSPPPGSNLITITGTEAHHLRNVLRLKPGARIICCDGLGVEFDAQLEKIDAHAATALILDRRVGSIDPCRVTMGQGVLTAQKMDLVVQKGTELGITTIVPFLSRHCTVREPAAAKAQRWQRIAREACKQCRRAREPEILPPQTWNECLSQANKHDLSVIFWEKAQGGSLHELRDLIGQNRPTSLLFLIGPEGGFAGEEIERAREKGFTCIGLGKRILRAETASLAAATLVQYLAGNLG